MPRIPRYDNQVGIQARKVTAGAPAVKIPAENFTSETRAASQFGVTISSIAENIIKVKADQEYAKAKIESYKALLQIENEASQDDDFQNFEPKYAKKIKDMQEAILKTIRNPSAKRQFQQDFELKSTYSFYDIMADGRKRFLAYDKDLMAQETAITKERYFSASTLQEKQNAKDELASIFSRRAENRILNKAEAANLYQKELANLVEGQVDRDILANPAYALGELQKGEQGIYQGLAQDKRIDLIKSAESRIEKLKNQQEEAVAIAMNQKEADLIDLKIAGTLTESQVKVERQAGAISARFADSMISALRSPKTINAKTDFEIYENIMADIVNSKITASEIRIKILNAYTEGKLSDSDRDSLLFVGKMGQDPIFKKSIEEQNPNIFQKIWRSVRNFFKGGIEDRVNAMNNIIKKARQEPITEDKIPQLMDEEIRKNRLTKYPWMANLPQGGEVRLFPDGTKRRFYPDGRIEDVK